MAGPDPPVWGGEAEGLHRPGAPCGGGKSANCSRRHYIHGSERCQEQRERFKKRSKLLELESCGGEKSANCSRRHYIHGSERCQEQKEC
jgi:hypothetical protein